MDQVKFLLQVLLAPIAIAIVGFVINSTLQEKQRDFEKLKFSEQIISTAFDGNNPDKAFAVCRLLPKIFDQDPVFADALTKLIQEYYIKKAELAIQTGAEAEYKQIVHSAQVFDGGNLNVLDSLKTNKITGKAEVARALETKGIESLQNGDLTAAQNNFDKADKAYPGYHSAYEISNLIKEKKNKINDNESNKKEIQKEIMDTIAAKYSWKLPPRPYYR